MIPIAVLIGRNNVGKSSLFNILTKKRKSLVLDFPKTTRDRKYGYCQLKKNQKMVLIDTAGLNKDSNEIQKKAYEQTLIAIQESNLILFVVNAQDGLVSEEIEIIKKIRKFEKKIILIINKIDKKKNIANINDFYSLGIQEIQKISVTHNQGIQSLILKHIMPWIKLKYKKENFNQKIKKNEKTKKSLIKIALIGRPNVGKSTLINSFLKENRMITCNIPKTTLDSVSIPFEYHKKEYCLIDTAGVFKKKKKINNVEKFSIIKTFQTIKKANIILLIIDIIDANNICNQDLLLADFIIKCGKSIIIVINKWDLLSSLEKKRTKETIKKKLKFLYFVKIYFISALYKKGIFQIFKSIKEINEISEKKISTSKLTTIMQEAVKKHQPPIIKKRRIKLKYAHLSNSSFLKIIIHGNQLKHLSITYKKYLINFFHEKLKIKNTPIQIKFKENKNPYIEKY